MATKKSRAEALRRYKVRAETMENMGPGGQFALSHAWFAHAAQVRIGYRGSEENRENICEGYSRLRDEHARWDAWHNYSMAQRYGLVLQ